MGNIISRLAPSPTGLLHLGNAWSFVMCWLITRFLNGKLLLRIDDLDPQRSRGDYVLKIIEDLEWLGLDWEENADNSEIYYQSQRNELYVEALEKLQKAGRLYPCFCSRRELKLLASAPHAGENWQSPFCPCRGLPREKYLALQEEGRPYALKMRTEPTKIVVNDLFYGKKEYDMGHHGGDIALRRSDGVFAYQLASVVDDAQMGVNLIVRGRDLLDSAPIQIMILKELGFEPPAYAHVPLILDREGERLAKRHGSLSIASLRHQGLSAQNLIGLFSFWAGLQTAPRALKLNEALELFDMHKLPTHDIRIMGELS